MSAKELHFGDNARNDILHGIDKLANAVKITLGPRGRNVLLDKQFGSPFSTKDGVTVAKEIELNNRFENMGAQLVREVFTRAKVALADLSAPGSGGAFGGMNGPSACVITRDSRLALGSPALTTSPDCEPFLMPSKVETLSCARASSPPWQRAQRLRSRGFT